MSPAKKQQQQSSPSSSSTTPTHFLSPDICFCPSCGSLLPAIPNSAPTLDCLFCKQRIPIESFSEGEVSYTVSFNKRSAERSSSKTVKKEEDEELTTVERRCPKCGNETMGYAALQLRSADEGQTVFFTCTKCRYKETENS